METFKLDGKTFLPAAMDIDYIQDFCHWNIIEWQGHSIKPIDIVCSYYTMPKKKLRIMIDFLDWFTKESGHYLSYGPHDQLTNKRYYQRHKILNEIGPRPFENPKSLWEQHANLGNAVILSKDDYRLPYLRKAGFKILPWPMFFGMYHDDYTEVRVSVS